MLFLYLQEQSKYNEERNDDTLDDNNTLLGYNIALGEPLFYHYTCFVQGLSLFRAVNKSIYPTMRACIFPGYLMKTKMPQFYFYNHLLFIHKTCNY